jgi:hypothetical protein
MADTPPKPDMPRTEELARLMQDTREALERSRELLSEADLLLRETDALLKSQPGMPGEPSPDE